MPARGRCLSYPPSVENTVTPSKLALQHFHHRSQYEIARKLAGDPEEARRIIKEIAACRAPEARHGVGSVDNGRHAPQHPAKASADEPRAFTAWTSSLRESEPTFEGERSVATRD